MKIELNKETTDLLKNVMLDIGAPDTADNRQTVASIAMSMGFASMMMWKGCFQALKEEFDIDPMIDHKEEPQQEPTPIKCPDCEKPVIHNGAHYVCNCRFWPAPPLEPKP